MAFLVLSIAADDRGRGERISDATWRKVAATIGALLGLASLVQRFV